MGVRRMKMGAFHDKAQYGIHVGIDSPFSKWKDRSFRLKAKRIWKKKFISESYAWPGYGYTTIKGAESWWFTDVGAESSLKRRRFSFRLKAKRI